MPSPGPEPKVNQLRKPPARVSYQEVLQRMRSPGDSNSHANGAGQFRGFDIAAISERLANAVELRTVASVVRDMEPGSGSPSQAAFAPIDLAALITALSTAKSAGGDASGPWTELMKYVRETDQATLRAELAELRHGLTQPGGNPTLELIQVLKELGVIGGQPKEQPSPVQQLTDIIAMVNLLRPPAPAAPATMFQLPNGGVLALGDLLQLEDLKDRRAERQERHALQRERIAATRELLGGIASTISDAAAAVKAEASTPAPDNGYRVPPKTSAAQAAQSDHGAPQALRSRQTERDLSCDFCGATNQVDLTQTPDSFTCTQCQERNVIVYADS